MASPRGGAAAAAAPAALAEGERRELQCWGVMLVTLLAVSAEDLPLVLAHEQLLLSVCRFALDGSAGDRCTAAGLLVGLQRQRELAAVAMPAGMAIVSSEGAVRLNSPFGFAVFALAACACVGAADVVRTPAPPELIALAGGGPPPPQAAGDARQQAAATLGTVLIPLFADVLAEPEQFTMRRAFSALALGALHAATLAAASGAGPDGSTTRPVGSSGLLSSPASHCHALLRHELKRPAVRSGMALFV